MKRERPYETNIQVRLVVTGGIQSKMDGARQNSVESEVARRQNSNGNAAISTESIKIPCF